MVFLFKKIKNIQITYHQFNIRIIIDPERKNITKVTDKALVLMQAKISTKMVNATFIFLPAINSLQNLHYSNQNL